MEWNRPSVKIMHAINDIIKNYATKYPIESRFSSKYITPDDEEKLHKIFDEDIDKYKDLPEYQAVLANLYDAFQLKRECSFFGEKRTVPQETKAKIVLAFWDEYRTPFSREEERIICLNAFRRLQYKTQVMVNSAADDQRTRLLHSMEVERAARKIAVAVGANYELVSVIALAHDIGHTPFGHAGERAIDQYLSRNWMGRFAHALQGVKVLDKLCVHPKMKEFGIEGLGLSKYVLEGVLKHDADSFVDDVSSPAFRLQYDCNELIGAVGCEDYKIDSPKDIKIGSIESQIVAWADKIEYIGHDWEECIQFGLLDKMVGRINNIVIKMSFFQSKKDVILKEKCNFEERTTKNSKELELEYIENVLDIIKGKGYLFSDYNNVDKAKWEIFYNESLSCVLDYLEALSGEKVQQRSRKKIETIVQPYFFSREQYQCLFDFFNITNAWVNLTDTYPKQNGVDFDLIYVFFDYLTKTTSYTITPKLTQCLIMDTNKSIEQEKNEDRYTIICKCNKKWSELLKEREKTQDNKSKWSEKDIVRLSFHATFSETNYDYIKTILNFIGSQYIKSTRVQNMNLKAELIITKLLEFYCNSPEMLPFTQRNRLAREISSERLNHTTEKILIQYFLGIINGSKKEIQKAIETELKEKFSFEKNDTCIRADVVEKVITTRLVVDYVAGMTDRMAEMKYNEIVSSNTNWSTVYGE